MNALAHFSTSMEGHLQQPFKKGALLKKRSRPKRILVVDDGSEQAQALVLQLKFLGHYVRTVGGNAALEIGARFLPEVLLLNLELAGNGQALARVIRHQPWGRTVRLVAIGAWEETEEGLRSSATGFDDRLPKPFGINELKVMLGL